MPMPTKFTSKRRELILVCLSAGGSRRTAAQISGLDPSTLAKWIAIGARSAPESRFARFRDEVVAAEAGSHRPRLLPLREAPAREINAAWSYLVENEFLMPEPEPPVPVQVRVFFSDGAPIRELP
jgi:hypothetical protein